MEISLTIFLARFMAQIGNKWSNIIGWQGLEGVDGCWVIAMNENKHKLTAVMIRIQPWQGREAWWFQWGESLGYQFGDDVDDDNSNNSNRTEFKMNLAKKSKPASGAMVLTKMFFFSPSMASVLENPNKASLAAE